MNFVGFLACSFMPGSLIWEWRVLWVSPVFLVVVGVMVLFRTGRAFYAFERAIIEDEGLRKEFGRDWEVWAEKVRYRILVGVF